MKNPFFRYAVIALYVITGIVLLIVLTSCSGSSKPVPSVTTETQGLVLKQSSDFGVIGLDALVQAVLRGEDRGVQFTVRYQGGGVTFTKGDGCLWNWTATVNNIGGTVCIKNPAELVRQEMLNHNPYKIPSLVTVDTYGVPLPQMPEHRYLVGVTSDSPGSRVPEQSLTNSEIRGLIRRVQGDPESGAIYFPSPKEFPSYTIRMYYTGDCKWEWEHRSANGEIFAQGTVVDCDLANSDMIPFMLEWR